MEPPVITPSAHKMRLRNLRDIATKQSDVIKPEKDTRRKKKNGMRCQTKEKSNEDTG
jgi:hypothetical protein